SPTTSSSSSSSSDNRLMKILQTLFIQQFGRSQVNYTYLSDKGRRTVEWIGRLSVLISIELMSITKLSRVFQQPIHQLSDFDSSTSFASQEDRREVQELITK